jgi:type IV secretory pathway VirB2 component (pilin)
MVKLKEFALRHRVSLAIAVGSAVALVATPAAAEGTPDPVDAGFTTMGTTLVGYLVDAVVLVLAVLGLALGVRLLVKWAKVAVRST